MKIVLNQDLINSIYLANSNTNLRLIKKEIGCYIIPHGIISLLMHLSIQEMVITFPFALLGGIINPLSHSIITEIKEMMEEEKKQGKIDLLCLIEEFHEHRIDTNLDLLYQMEEYKRIYKPGFQDNKINIVEEKYLILPTIKFNGEQSSVSLLQEHTIGEKEYTLSLGSPKQLKKVKPVFNM